MKKIIILISFIVSSHSFAFYLNCNGKFSADGTRVQIRFCNINNGFRVMNCFLRGNASIHGNTMYSTKRSMIFPGNCTSLFFHTDIGRRFVHASGIGECRWH